MKTTTVLKQEQAGSVFGVNGRFFAVTVYGNDQAIERCRGRIASQKFVSEARPIDGYGTNGRIKVTIRYDDDCKNGHESFAITASVTTLESLRYKHTAAFGCLHDEISKVFPEFEPLIKWHHMQSDGPMHYIANTRYHAGNRELDKARSSAIWPDASDEQLSLEKSELTALLDQRLPGLIAEFKTVIANIGFLFEDAQK